MPTRPQCPTRSRPFASPSASLSRTCTIPRDSRGWTDSSPTSCVAPTRSSAGRWLAARADPAALEYKAEAELLIAVAPHLDRFVARLFAIEEEWQELVEGHHRLAPLFRVKRKFVQRRAMLKIKADAAQALDGPALEAEVAALLGGAFDELVFAEAVLAWVADEKAHGAELEIAERFAAWAAHTAEGRRRYKGGVLFKPPQRVDPLHLVPVETDTSHGYSVHTLHHIRRREGFALTDPGTDLAGALDEANYCIWCHEQDKDSCSKGLKEKPAEDGRIEFKKSPFGVPLHGCPLEERISEFHKLKSEGWAVGALAMIVIDNPTVCGTGHRICNDCMKSCIYQRQDPVNIPQAETRTLKDVLELPWGFEIYGLLTRWNPLNLRRPMPQAATGKRVLVVGMGPAGFTLAHHLMNDGHTVVGIDGLKIEPLDASLCGVKPDGTRVPFRPIHDVAELREPLESRVMAGFGGVAEYGITVRWDKNFLKIGAAAGRAPGALRDVRRRALRRHAHGRGCVRHGLRPRRARRGRRQAHGARHGQRPGARRAHRLRFPHGPAAHRGGAHGFHRQPAGAPAHRGGGRRPHRDRHRDRVPRLLRGAGGEVPRALRAHGGREERGRSAQRMERGGDAPSPRSTSRTPSPSAPSASKPPRKAARRASWNCCNRGAARPSPTASG